MNLITIKIVDLFFNINFLNLTLKNVGALASLLLPFGLLRVRTSKVRISESSL